jgi:hypothetical protein
MSKQKLWRGASSKTSLVARSKCRRMLSTLGEEEFRPQHQRERHLTMMVKNSERAMQGGRFVDSRLASALGSRGAPRVGVSRQQTKDEMEL